MRAIRLLVLSATFIASAVALTAMPGRVEAGLACKPMAYGKGVSIRKSHAGHVAITKWSALVRNRYGLAYAAFRNAADRSNDCAQVRGKWRCVARGRPCGSGPASWGARRGMSPFEPIRRSRRQLSIRP